MAPKPLAADFMKDIRKKSCGFVGNDPLVCCPPANVLPRSFREVTTEKPWIWGISNGGPNSNNVFNRLNPNGNTMHHRRPNDIHSPQKPSRNKNVYSRKNKKRPYFDFEDPRTFRNCPPSFSPDFHIPPHLLHVKPIKDFHFIGNNGFKPNAFDHNSLDNGPNFAFPNPAIEVTTFPSRAAHLRLKKLKLINQDNCGISINTRIIGGQAAAPGQFPW